MDKIKFVGIKAKDGIYISDNILGKSDYSYNSKIEKYKFDGKYGIKSYSKDWVLIDKVPEIVELTISAQNINQRYELKDGFPESQITPKVIVYNEIDDYDFDGISGLYEYKFDLAPETFDVIEFEINIIDSIDNFKPVIQQYQIENGVLDKIMFHPVLLQTRPCKMSVDQSYKIIRDYIKKNINNRFAKITSDYDFCFTVEKIIDFNEPEEYQVDVNNINNYSKRKRKPKMETRYRLNRRVKVYEVAPKSYQKYPIVEPFMGTSYENMMENVETYLNELIEEINKPLVDCPNCNGMGVIIGE